MWGALFNPSIATFDVSKDEGYYIVSVESKSGIERNREKIQSTLHTFEKSTLFKQEEVAKALTLWQDYIEADALDYLYLDCSEIMWYFDTREEFENVELKALLEFKDDFPHAYIQRLLIEDAESRKRNPRTWEYNAASLMLGYNWIKPVPWKDN